MSSRVQDLLTELHTSAVSNFTTDILLPNPTIGQAPSETVNEVSPKVIGAVIGGAVGCVLVLAIIIHLLLQKKKHPSAHLRSKQLKQDVYTISGESGKESSQWMPQLCEEGIHMPIEAEKTEKYSSQPSTHEFLNEGFTRSNPQNTKNSFENRLYNHQHLYDPKDSKNNKRSGAKLSSLGTVPSDTVSQYLAPPTLEGSDVMTRGTPSRRSRSLENIPVNQRRSAANKSATMASQDSGFVSANSIATSPVSPSSIKEYPWQPNQHPSTTRIVQARELIAYAIEKFYSMPDRQVGKCYASSIFAIGEFDCDGGRLYPAGDMSVSLTIPAGALKTTQLVYLLMSYDNNESGDHTENFSPTIECGPDGLQFEKPVVLTMPHAAINMELETLACEGGSAEWTVDSSETGPTVIHSSGETVSISIHHFTGFKMSRIPVRSRGVGSSTPLASQGKKLSFRVYTCGDKARIYFVCKPSSSNMSTRIIDNKESALGFRSDSPWKDFSFFCGYGGLVVEATREIQSQPILYKRFPFTEEKVMRANHESVEFIATETPLILNINAFQPSYKPNYTQFCIKLERNSTPSSLLVADERRIEYEQLRSLMLNLELQSSLFSHRHADTLLLPAQSRSYGRSISDTFEHNMTSYRTPEENCEHGNDVGACNCWQGARNRSPVESEYGEINTQEIRRGVTHRRSKESGYESCSVQSPVSPLKGPESMYGAPSSNLELSIHSLQGGRNTLQTEL